MKSEPKLLFGIDQSILDRTAIACRSIVRSIGLNLQGRSVLTECATGAYCSTAVLAAYAGAKVFAFGKNTQYGSFSDAQGQTGYVANLIGVRDRIEFVESVNRELLAHCDIVTNSGHLRPLDRTKISALRQGAVIPLMYEAWEYREADIDLKSCQEFDVRVVGTNEHHSKLMVFDYLGMLALKGLFELGIPVLFCRVLLLSDNLFALPISKLLRSVGAQVFVMDDSPIAGTTGIELASQVTSNDGFDAVVLAMTPTHVDSIGKEGNSKYCNAQLNKAKSLVQIWGDVDRDALEGFRFYPEVQPKRGHMGVLLNDIGPDAVVRLQAGGLRAAQEMIEGGSDDGLENYSERMVG